MLCIFGIRHGGGGARLDKGAKGKGKNGTDTKAVDSGKATDVGDERAGDGGESKVARASALVARCQRLEQENEELASSADVSRGDPTVGFNK